MGVASGFAGRARFAKGHATQAASPSSSTRCRQKAALTFLTSEDARTAFAFREDAEDNEWSLSREKMPNVARKLNLDVK